MSYYPWDAARYFVRQVLIAAGAHTALVPKNMGGCEILLKNRRGKMVYRLLTELEIIMGVRNLDEDDYAKYCNRRGISVEEANFPSGWKGLLILNCEYSPVRIDWMDTRIDCNKRKWLIEKYKGIIQEAIDNLPRPNILFSAVINPKKVWTAGGIDSNMPAGIKDEFDQFLQKIQDYYVNEAKARLKSAPAPKEKSFAETIRELDEEIIRAETGEQEALKKLIDFLAKAGVDIDSGSRRGHGFSHRFSSGRNIRLRVSSLGLTLEGWDDECESCSQDRDCCDSCPYIQSKRDPSAKEILDALIEKKKEIIAAYNPTAQLVKDIVSE